MAKSGKDVIIMVNTAAVGQPVVWTAAAQQQGLDITRGRNTQTVGHKDSSTDVVIAGNKVKSMTFNGLLVRSDYALGLIRTAYENGQLIKVRYRDAAGFIEEWLGNINQFDESHPHDGASTYSCRVDPADDPQTLS